MRDVAAVVLVLLGAAAVAAAAEVLTPESAVAIAVANHPALVAAEREVDLAAAELDLARSGWLPRVDAVVDVARSTNPAFVFASKLGQERFGAQDFGVPVLNEPAALTNVAERIVLRQNVWDAGRTSLARRAGARGVEAAAAGRDRTREEIAFGALNAFWDAALAEEMLRVAHGAEAAARASLDLATAQVEEGAAVPSDRMQAEVRHAEVRSLSTRAREGLEVARAALRQALGLERDEPFELGVPEIVPRDVADEAESRDAAARASRGDLRALEARRQQAEVGERLARSGRLPVIGVGAQAEWNSSEAFSASGSNWTLGAALSVPIFDGRATRATAARAAAERARVAAQLRALEELVRLELRAALAQRASAAERLRTTESVLGHAAEALRIVRERYGEGMALMVELLAAEAAHTAAQGGRAQAVHDLALARAAVDLASGRSLVPSAEPEP
jgi:outer membrane protein TolC